MQHLVPVDPATVEITANTNVAILGSSGCVGIISFKDVVALPAKAACMRASQSRAVAMST